MASTDDSRVSAAEVSALLDKALQADARNMYAVARAHYEAILRSAPGHIFALSRLLTFDGMEGRLDDADQRHRALIDLLNATDLTAVHWPWLVTVAFQSLLRPLPQALYKSVVHALDRHMPPPSPPRTTPPLAGRRLKVGYLSGFFRDHPVGHVTAALFAAHDRTRFDVHVFYRSDDPPNPYTEKISNGAEHFYTLSGPAQAMADVIAAQDLDILIYIDGYTEVHTLITMALRPAPIQAFWLGHPGGCDISAIDYLLTDATIVPPGEEHLYDAKIARLPGAYHCASPHRIAGPVTRAWAGLPDEGFVFCAFNNPDKIDRAVFGVWMNILKRVDGSVLWLSRGQSPAAEDNFRAAATAHGVDGRRLLFAARLPDKASHMARHGLCGLFLDTFVFNAHSTALDALWAGLPVLTVEGSRPAARFGATALRSIGLDGLIMATPAEYEERAVHLATHPGELEDLRGLLAGNRYTEPLFQIDLFCRGLEDTLERIAREHVPGKRTGDTAAR